MTSLFIGAYINTPFSSTIKPNTECISTDIKPEFRILNPNALELSKIKDLYASCEWDWLEPDSEMHLAFKGSFRLYGCLIENKLVGFGRLISDGKIYGLLIDFMVQPEFRRRGIGTILMEYIINDCRKKDLKVIQLLASPDGFPP